MDTELKNIDDVKTFYFFGEFGWFNIYLLKGLSHHIKKSYQHY